MKFEVHPNRRYLITEKPHNDTPIELEKEGKSKAGTVFFEFAGCPWNETKQKYDTGLDRTSAEFKNKTEGETNKILEEREELRKHLDYLRGDRTENDFLANFKLKVYHNEIIDTSDRDNYLKLYLAMRGTTITPSNDKGNLDKYKNSNYQIVNADEQKDAKKELAQMKRESQRWLLKKLDNDKETAIAYLKYVNMISINEKPKEDDLLVETFTHRIDQDYSFLREFYHAIKSDSVKKDDVFLNNEVRQKISKGKIVRQNGKYIYNGVELGANVPEVVFNLKQKEYKELVPELID